MSHKCKSSYLTHTNRCDPDCWLTSKDEKLMTQVLWHDDGLVETIYWRDLGQHVNQFFVTLYHRDNPTTIVTANDEYLTTAQQQVHAQAPRLVAMAAGVRAIAA